MKLSHFFQSTKKIIGLDHQASVSFLLIVGPLLTILAVLLVFGHQYSSASSPGCTGTGGWWNGPPIKIERYTVSNATVIDTGIKEKNYYCVAGGWWTTFDYNEDEKATIGVWTYTDGGVWKAFALFPIDDNKGGWAYMDVVCFSTDIAYWDTANGKGTDYSQHFKPK